VLRRLIYLASLSLASAVLGYGIALRGAETEPTVTVAPAATPPPPAIDWTQLSDEDLRVAHVFLIARTSGVEVALDTLQALAEGSPAVARRGHQLAHSLGRATIARAGNDPAVLARCRPLFQAGCYHGVLEGYLSSVSDVDARTLTGLCAELDQPGKPVISARECAHGLGHGLIERVGYDFTPALHACDAFDSPALREECHDGVFMQNLVTGHGLPTTSAADEAAEGPTAEANSHEHGGGAGAGALAAGKAGFRADDLTFPCSTVSAEYQPSCWSYQPVAVRRFLGDPGLRTLYACDLAPEASRARCYAGYGKQTLSRYDNDEMALIDLCTTAMQPYDDACLGGIVELLVDREWGPNNAIAFCERVEAFGRDATACYRTLGERISLLHAERRETEAVCARAEDPRHVTACMRGDGR
jgi:hypothetical protein